MNDLELLRVIEYLQRTRSRPLDTPWIEHISATCKPLIFAWNARSRSHGMVAHDGRGTAAHDLRIAQPKCIDDETANWGPGIKCQSCYGSGDEFDECSCVRVRGIDRVLARECRGRRLVALAFRPASSPHSSTSGY